MTNARLEFLLTERKNRIIVRSSLPGIARYFLYACKISSVLYGRGIMGSELLLKYIGYFPDYLLALLRTLLRFFFFFFEQSLSKQLYTSLHLRLRNTDVCITKVKVAKHRTVKWAIWYNVNLILVWSVYPNS